MENALQWILGIVLIFSGLGVILSKKPVHSCLWFLLTLMTLATYFLQLSAEFIAVMQILVYAGAILVIFMFVIVLFQDAYQRIARIPPSSTPALLIIASVAFVLGLGFIGAKLLHPTQAQAALPDGFGTVQSLGHLIYIDYFFPFEAVIFIFLIAIIGSLYIGKKET